MPGKNPAKRLWTAIGWHKTLPQHWLRTAIPPQSRPGIARLRCLRPGDAPSQLSKP